MIFIKRLVQLFLLSPVLVLLYLNWQLYYSPKCERNINQEVINQLSFLANELKNKEAAPKMQSLFPEGFIFMNVIYGLTWADVLEKAESHSDIYKKGHSEIKWSLEQILSDEGKSIFDPNLPLSYGAFYKGWTSYLAGRYLQLTPFEERDTHIVNLFKTNCSEIKKAIEKTDNPYLETYSNAIWPADNILCLASLNLFDKIYPPQYLAIEQDWLNRIKQHLDKKTGLIPHSYSFLGANDDLEVRGSSQSLILSILPAIDSVFAKGQFDKYKTFFIINRLGLPAIAEYPADIQGLSDVDSGPVIWDVGAVASIMGIKTAFENKDWVLYKSLRNNIEAFGFPLTKKQEKQYLLGKLPMADAFIAWANVKSCKINDGEIENTKGFFQILSLIVIVLFSWWAYRL